MSWDWGTIINYGTQLAGAYMESQGAKDASRAETQGYQAGIDEQRRQFDTIMGLQAPYRQVGGQALNALARLYGYAPAPVPLTPGTVPNSLASSQIGSSGYGIAPNGAVTQGAQVAGGQNADQILRGLYAGGFTQEGVNALYAARGLSNPPIVPQSLVGQPITQTRGGRRLTNGGAIANDANDFLNVFGRQAVDPYRQQSGISQVAGGLLDVASTYFPVLGAMRAGAELGNASLAGRGTSTNGVQFQQGTPGQTGTQQYLDQSGLPTGMAVFEASPDYQFRRNEGMRGIENSFAARGGAASGNALRALSEYNSNLASGEFGNYFNRQAALAGIGQTATNNTQSAAQNTGANVTNLLGQQGQSRASGVAGQTNAWTNTLQGLLSSYNRNNTGGNTAWNTGWGGGTNWAGGGNW